MIDLDGVLQACAELRRSPTTEAQIYVRAAAVVNDRLRAVFAPAERATAARALLLGLVVGNEVVLRNEPHLCGHTFGDVLALAGQQLLVDDLAEQTDIPSTVPHAGPSGPAGSTGGQS